MYGVSVHCRKGNFQTFQVLLDTGSKLVLIFKDPKLHHRLCIIVRTHIQGPGDRVLPKVWVYSVSELTWYSFPKPSNI